MKRDWTAINFSPGGLFPLRFALLYFGTETAVLDPRNGPLTTVAGSRDIVGQGTPLFERQRSHLLLNPIAIGILHRIYRHSVTSFLP